MLNVFVEKYKEIMGCIEKLEVIKKETSNPDIKEKINTHLKQLNYDCEKIEKLVIPSEIDCQIFAEHMIDMAVKNALLYIIYKDDKLSEENYYLYEDYMWIMASQIDFEKGMLENEEYIKFDDICPRSESIKKAIKIAEKMDKNVLLERLMILNNMSSQKSKVTSVGVVKI